MIHTDLQKQIQNAMRAKEELKLSTLRGLLSAFTNELVAQKRKPTETLSDEEAFAVIRRQVKQRKDSIDQFRKGNREDLASKEEAEMQILEAYLPAMMSRDDIRKVVEAKKTEMGITDKSQMGQFMGAVMKELKGKAEGDTVKAVIEEVLT
jgi:uncharacterized protein YqeY